MSKVEIDLQKAIKKPVKADAYSKSKGKKAKSQNVKSQKAKSQKAKSQKAKSQNQNVKSNTTDAYFI